jgi:hypothetical protein
LLVFSPTSLHHQALLTHPSSLKKRSCNALIAQTHPCLPHKTLPVKSDSGFHL